ncbi:MAG: YitT family protein [Roseburia sp.]|nr:YitT family protein [Roseburia sp.]
MTAKTKKRVHDFVKIPLMILMAAAMRAVCVSVFVLPYSFAPGGVTGIGTMIEYKTGFSTGYTMLIINAPLLVIAFFLIGRAFAVKSGIALLLSSSGMVLMQKFCDFTYFKVDEPVLAAVAAGVLGGVAFALIMRAGGSNGGTDIVAILIQRKMPTVNLTWYIYGLDAIVMIISVFVYNNGINPMLMSLTQEFSQAMVGDVITTGFKTAIKFEIITNNPEELSKELIEKLGRGVTCISAVGMYSHDVKSMVVCVIRKRQLAEFNKILKKYPDTFAYVITASEVRGKGFSV